MFKATRPDGTDFNTGRIDYASALESGATLKHPRPGRVGDSDAAGYFSVATVSTDCTSFRWPARLFEAEIVGETWSPSPSMPNKRAAHELKILRELPAWQLFGPRGESVMAIIETAALGYEERAKRYASRPPGWSSAYDNLWAVVDGGRACRAGLGAARLALGGHLVGFRDGYAAYCAALAVLLRDLIDPTDYDTLVAPYADVFAIEAAQ